MVVGGAIAVATLNGVVDSKVNTPLSQPDSVSQVGTIDYGSTAP